jgi:hypothetical protein
LDGRRARWLVPGFLLLLATCSEGSAAYVGDRFFPSTLATTVPTAADFYNPPYFVRLPDTATTPTTHEIDIPTTYSRLVTRDLGVFFTETFRILDDANRATRAGFDNFVIGAQYQLYSNPEHQFIFTVGGTAAIGGTGAPRDRLVVLHADADRLYRQGLRRSAGFDGVVTAAHDQRHRRCRSANRRHQPYHDDAAHRRDHALRDDQPEDPAVGLCPGIQPGHQLLYRRQPDRDPLPQGMGSPG